MASNAEKAGPVAGTDLRNFDLPINSEYSRSILSLQVARLTRLYAVNAAMAEALAPLIFLEVLR